MAGRKKAIIDWHKVDKHLEAGCNGVEIAAVLGVNPETLYRACKRDQKVDFVVYSQEKRSSGDSLLRMAQFKQAMSGDKTMLIWLGKNRLKQSDKSEVSSTVNMTSTIEDVRFEIPENDTGPHSESPKPPGWETATGRE